jgi:hypothetical protein
MAPTGRKGKVVVYAWIKENGFRVRTKINRGEVEDWWENYSGKQLRYNGFEDEWDLCTEFDPEASEQCMDEMFFPDDEETFGGYDCRDEPRVERPPPFKLGNLVPPPSQHSWGDDLTRAYGAGDPNDEVKVVGATEPLLDILHARFGFTLDISKFSYQKITDPTLQRTPWGDVRRNLANTKSSIPDEYKDAIGDFTDLLLADRDPPGSIWDLSPMSPWPLLGKSTCQDLIFELVNNEPYYFLNDGVRGFLNDGVRGLWQIMTRDAASALQCLRVCKHRREDLARYLLDRGIPFSTRIPSSIPPSGPPPPSIHSIGLGWRHTSYKPDAVDYTAYREQRDAFFRHPRARAALLRGGIVWRLAMQSISQDAVLAGPTDEVFTHGQVFQTSDGAYWWDDDLSEDELNLICGVYKVFTGKS